MNAHMEFMRQMNEHAGFSHHHYAPLQNYPPMRSGFYQDPSGRFTGSWSNNTTPNGNQSQVFYIKKSRFDPYF